MTPAISVLLLTIGLAPVPPEPPPDPLAWGYLGVRVNQGTLRIGQIEPNTPAEKAGLRADDEFVRVGDLKPQSFDDVVEHIGGFRPGTVLQVQVMRGGELKAFTVRLGVRPAELPPPTSRGRVIPDDPDR